MYGLFQIGANTRRLFPTLLRNLPYTRSIGPRTASARGASTLSASSLSPRHVFRGTHEHRDAGLHHGLDVLPCVLLLYGEDQVRLELQDAGYVHLLGPAHLRNSADGAGRLGAVSRAADNPLPHAEGEERLREARHQADDAFWGHDATEP
jgi:hypothetical protein